MTLNLPSKSHIKHELEMSQEDFRENQIELTEHLDSDTVVPVVVYDRHGVPKYIGCNSYPRGVRRSPERQTRPEKYLWIEHSERNAIFWMAREGISTRNCVICILWYPCADCARAIVQSGMVGLICSRPNLKDPTWGKSFSVAQSILSEGGVTVEYYDEA